MASVDSLPGDQRAVLTLVLGRGRSYEEIARLLTIEPDAVSGRASAALDALGPPTDVAAGDRELIGDYLLGQLPADELSDLQDLLAGSPPARAWARGVRAALEPLAAGVLPAVVVQAGDPSPAAPAPGEAAAAPPPHRPAAARAEPAAAPEPPRRRAPAAQRAAPAREPAAAREARPGRESAATGSAAAADEPKAPRAAGDEPQRSSRAGGAALILVVVIVVAALVVIFTRGHQHHSPTADRSAATATNPSASHTSTSASSSVSATPIAQVNLSPTSPTSKATAIADILQDGSRREVAIIGQDVPANTKHDSYEVWLYNSESDAVSLGFVSPGVTSNGKLSSAGLLPTNAARYKKIIITTETASKPTQPGPILLSGALSGLS